jgi:excinuclease ABC subunit A
MDPTHPPSPDRPNQLHGIGTSGMVRVRGAREHNLKNIDVDIPRDALVVFTGVSGSGKSSLAFGTLYAEAQRRYLESVSPYARRLFHQLTVPEVDSIDGLPPAVALQQQRGSPTTRSSVGSVTTLSNLIRMLYSRAGDYPRGKPMLYAENFSPNRPEGACPKCHGLGRVYEVTEQTMVPDPSLTIRQRAIAAWPTAWQGQNQRDILVSLGYDVDRPWRDLPKKDRNWILFTDDQPTVPVYAGFTPAETRRALRKKMEPSYMGTFTSARRYVMETFSKTQSAMMKRRVSAYMLSTECPVCHGKRLRADALEVKFAGLDIAELGALPLKSVRGRLVPYADHRTSPLRGTPEKSAVALRITQDIVARLDALLLLGLGYLALERSTPTLSPGELQRLRLATQMHSNLFGVVYVLDEPSAGLHPSDTETLLHALDALKRAGNSLFVIEHEVDVIRRADWIVDVGPGAGEKGGEILYSGPPAGLRQVQASKTRLYFDARVPPHRAPRKPAGWLRLEGATRNNLHSLDVEFPLGLFTSVTGVSGSGKSTLVSQVLVELVAQHLGQKLAEEDADEDPLTSEKHITTGVKLIAGMEKIHRLVQVDQKPIGRTPRSNMATYTGLFDHVRRLFASTKMARERHYDAGRFSFNVAKGRCPTCSGEGFVCVELLFLPSVYSPCPACHGARFNPKTLEVKYHDKSIAEVLALTVDAAVEFFQDDAESGLQRALSVLSEVGLGYLRLGQPATELSGGEAQRIKLATELQRPQKGDTLYVLDEPTTGLHPSDVERLLAQLNRLVENGNTVIVVEHDLDIIAASDWVIDIGPGAGDEGGGVVVDGTPQDIARSRTSRTAPYLRALAAA